MAASPRRFFISLLDGWLATMPGLLELLDCLESAAIPKAIATSSSRELVHECLSRSGCSSGSNSFSRPKTSSTESHTRKSI